MLARKEQSPVPERKPVNLSNKWYYLYWGAGIGVSLAMIIYGVLHNQMEVVYKAGGYL